MITLYVLDLESEAGMNFYRKLDDFQMNIIPMSQKDKSTLNNYGDLLSVSDLVDLFGVSRQTIYKEIMQRKFGNPICIGRAFKIPKIYLWNKFFANYT
ncbi:MAG: hypothetical protein FWB80_09255 [Defluviitaleaceae bacterium]|nr:hypothetical protein [Defluviitaleaceae bacterium]